MIKYTVRILLTSVRAEEGELFVLRLRVTEETRSSVTVSCVSEAKTNCAERKIGDLTAVLAALAERKVDQKGIFN